MRFGLGDKVTILAFDQEGEVTDVDDTMAEVQFGSMKTRQPIEELKRLGRARVETQTRVPVVQSTPGFVSMETDIRGFRVSEVPEMLERYLDEAYRFGLPYAHIIHRKGTGALRKVVKGI